MSLDKKRIARAHKYTHTIYTVYYEYIDYIK